MDGDDDAEAGVEGQSVKYQAHDRGRLSQETFGQPLPPRQERRWLDGRGRGH